MSKNPWIHIYDALPPELLRQVRGAANDEHLGDLRQMLVCEDYFPLAAAMRLPYFIVSTRCQPLGTLLRWRQLLTVLGYGNPSFSDSLLTPPSTLMAYSRISIIYILHDRV